MQKKIKLEDVRAQILKLRAVPKVNVLNPEHIDLYAVSLMERISGTDNENYIAKWVNSTMRKHLLNSKEFLVRAVDVVDCYQHPDLFHVDADTLQPWAAEALERNELYVWNVPSDEEVEKQLHWMDFLATLPNRQIRYTVDSLVSAVQKWDVAMWKAGSGKDVLTGCELVETKTFADTKYVMVLLMTEKAYKNEGAAQSHCVSTYWKRKDTVIYSLRDTTAKPEDCRVATIEIKSKTLSQVRGRKNEYVSDEVRQLVREWAIEMQFKLSRYRDDDEEEDDEFDEDEDDDEDEDEVPHHRHRGGRPRLGGRARDDDDEDDEDF